MRYKLQIFHLLFALAFLPAAQAVSPATGSGQTAHNAIIMDCGQVDPGHCIDFGPCVSDGHSSCDVKTDAGPSAMKTADRPVSGAFGLHPPAHYFSHCSELLLRPPRNA